MNFDAIQNTADKALLLENAVNSILLCNEQISILKAHFSRLRLPFPVHSSANFRDGFVHYEKLYTELLSTECACQKYAFDEHLQRCIKDACVLLANTYLSIFSGILTSNSLNEKKEPEFIDKRNQVEKTCNFIFDACPNLKEDLSFWSLENLTKVYLCLADEFFGTHKDIADTQLSREFYQRYFKACLFEYFKINGFTWLESDDIEEVRKMLHRLNNHVLMIRSQSTDLIKSYQSSAQDKFSEFITVSEDIYNFMKKHHFIGIMFFIL